jgi:DNA (cytosine-5)-methyltransferase 1
MTECPYCAGTGRLGPYWPGGLSTGCGHCTRGDGRKHFPFKVLDLFSGIGGFSLGLERTGGFVPVAFCEIDPFCRRVLAKHWPKVKQYDDIRNLTANQLRTDGITPNVICGGFPCQDISLAGDGLGLAGARSGLWSEYARLIGEFADRGEPVEYVLVENVAALLGRGLDEVLRDLAALGYDAEWHCIPASYAGLRHLRDRVWIVAYPKRNSVQGRAKITEAWRQKSRAEQLAGLVQPSAWPTISGARDRGTGHGVPNGTHRNKAIGNAVVPQVPELLGRAILESMREAA